MTDLRYIGGAELMALVSWSQAITAIETALREGATRESGPPRTAVPTASGELLLMPAETARAVGVKLATVAPDNPATGLPRVQAVYVLFDADTLTPRVLIDGTALTTLRTPAQSALAVRDLAVPDAGSLVVFGAGPQAWGHVHAIAAVRPIRSVTVVGRSREHAADLVARLRAEGVDAVVGTADGVRGADVIACATTAVQPLFDGHLIADHACVVAVGTHKPQDRELDDAVFARAARVVVEERGTALREAGDVVAAIAAGALAADRLVDLADLSGLPRVVGVSVFKGVGMGWQDLAVAEAAWLGRRA
jgi:ornithine cyclodeaminase/alanine dehydrogenase-like protein (mu-crystallin family)